MNRARSHAKPYGRAALVTDSRGDNDRKNTAREDPAAGVGSGPGRWKIGRATGAAHAVIDE
jgi:hypothetical protein